LPSKFSLVFLFDFFVESFIKRNGRRLEKRRPFTYRALGPAEMIAGEAPRMPFEIGDVRPLRSPRKSDAPILVNPGDERLVDPAETELSDLPDPITAPQTTAQIDTHVSSST
jgi:hypothetical protein